MWFAVVALGAAACGCGDDRVCEVAGGRYHALLPDHWDGDRALPVVLSAHGYGGSPDSLLSRSFLKSAYNDAGILWIVPEGADNSWKTRNSPESGDAGRRDDVEFLGSVLDDVAERWSVDLDRVAASGFSQGGSMASDLGCRDPDRWPVVMPISGTFWVEVPERCAAAVAVNHTHGLDDSTWPPTGRPIGSFHQGALADAMHTWVATAGCNAEPVVEDDGGLTCSVYQGCASGEVRVCLHDGGHTVLETEATRQLDWLASLGWF